MITQNLYSSVLIGPARRSNTLYIVSGYASPAMIYRHLNDLQEVNVNLIIGMTSGDGIGARIHNAIVHLAAENFNGRLECRYLVHRSPVHVKSYAWFMDNTPQVGFTGSANYTQNAFISNQGEAVVEDNAQEIRDYYQSLLQNTVNCLDPNIQNSLNIYDESHYIRRRVSINTEAVEENPIMRMPETENREGLQSVTLSFLDDRGNLPQVSGLNWGQRPGREPNQAYIRISSDVQKTNFFPGVGEHFVILTDDGSSINCVRAQANGKAIHSHENNSIIGLYFRRRIGVPNGAPVTLNDLHRYGRTNVTIYKIDNETYYMDFSVR